jgi:LPXTG-site transpeptidase (sortase) family protein
MRASAIRRNSLQGLFLLLGAAAVVAGFALTALGIFRLIEPDTPEPVPSLASQHRTDPGTVYDRPVGPGVEPAVAPQAVASASDPPLPDSAYRIVIESIGVNANVFTYGVDANRVPEVPLNGQDVAWYNFSARPGTGSNAVFAGHVTWNGRGVFYDLDSLTVGERIFLRGADGTELVYTVSESFVVDPNDPTSVSVMAATPEDVLTLITCDGTFYSTGDPVFGGEYTQRRIVRAALDGSSRPAASAGG